MLPFALLGPALMLSLLTVPAERKSVEFTEDTLAVVQKNIAAEKAVLVDVRSEEEWARGYVEGAIFLPVTSLRKHSLDVKKVGKTLPKKKLLYTYCAVGMRAKVAAKILEEQGYEVRALKPGYEELIKAGFKKGEFKEPPSDDPPVDSDSK